jgi:hypothetical protein
VETLSLPTNLISKFSLPEYEAKGLTNSIYMQKKSQTGSGWKQSVGDEKQALEE